MLSKNEIKYIQSLRLKKNREEAGLFVAEGPKVVGELLQEFPENIEKIYALPHWAENDQGFKGKITAITEEELSRISNLQTPNTVVGLCKQFPVQQPIHYKFALYLDAVQDPGNLGTIIRIADWFGVEVIVCSPGCADVYSHKVVQSTMASIGRVVIFYDEEENWLSQQSRPLYAATLSGKPVTGFGRREEGILLIGNESKGLRKELIEMASEQITISKRGRADSLNAAVATGIILSHLIPASSH